MSSKFVKKQLQNLKDTRETHVLGVKKPGVSRRRVARAAKRLTKQMEPKKEESLSQNLAYLAKSKGPSGKAKELMDKMLTGRGGRAPARAEGRDDDFGDEDIPWDF